MDGSMFDGLGRALLAIFIMGILLTWILTRLFSSDEIVSDKKIIPELRIVVNNNIVDTLYVYKLDD